MCPEDIGLAEYHSVVGFERWLGLSELSLTTQSCATGWISLVAVCSLCDDAKVQCEEGRKQEKVGGWVKMVEEYMFNAGDKATVWSLG